MSRRLATIAFCSLACLTGSARGEGDSPAERLLSAYAWYQTGERLAAANQWPLALGSYLEARGQIEEMVANHPDFEPEVVAYRREALEEAIRAAEERMTNDEHDVMMKYLDFIESLKEGERQRYSRDFKGAYTTLELARSILDELIAAKPEDFRAAVEAQHARLDSSIAWLEEQLNLRSRRTPSTGIADATDWGTTRYVKEADLPREGGVLMRSPLFPDSVFVISDDPAPASGGAAPVPAESATGTARTGPP